MKKLKNLKTFEGYFSVGNDMADKINVDADCDTCNDGKVRCVNCSSVGRDREACNVCKGTGWVGCPDCNGLSDCDNCSEEEETTNENLQEIESNDSDYTSLSDEAKVEVKGMVEYCINHEIGMGMDGGYESFDPDVKHPFRMELEKFSGYKSIED